MSFTPFIPGLCLLLHSPGQGLTGNLKNPALNAEGRDDQNHVCVFQATSISADKTARLNRNGFIFIGLLSGGDYEEVGLPRTGAPMPCFALIVSH